MVLRHASAASASFIAREAAIAVIAVCVLASCIGSARSGRTPARPASERDRSAAEKKGRPTTPELPASDPNADAGRDDIDATEIPDLPDPAVEGEAAFSTAPMDLPVQLGFATEIEDESGGALSAFHAALLRAENGEGQARVVFYGASHTASDFLTGYLRQQLQARFGEAGPGFVLPAEAWRWYRHSGIDFEPSRGWKTLKVTEEAVKGDFYGLAGAALEAAPRRPAFAALRTRPNGPLSGSAGRFELFLLKQPKGGQIEIAIDGEKPRRISTGSDKLETAYELIEVADGPHRLEIKAMGNGPVRIFGVAIESDKPGVVLDTLGIPGARARYHLLWNDEIYREHLQRRRPDLMVLAYGTNETGDDDVPIESYESELRKVVARIRETVPGASCLLVGPSDRPERIDKSTLGPRPRTAQLIEVQRRVARDYSCGFFDLVHCMGGPMSMVAWASAIPPYGGTDLVHFTRRGYERIGELLLQALLANYSEW